MESSQGAVRHTSQVEFYEDDAGEHRWRVLAPNGEIVCTGEGHTRERDAVRAFIGARRHLDFAAQEFSRTGSV